MPAKTIPVCRYAHPGRVWKLTRQPWQISRELAAAVLREARKRRQLLRFGAGRYLLLGLADQVMTTRP